LRLGAGGLRAGNGLEKEVLLLRASVGSTEASNSCLARVGRIVVGSTDAPNSPVIQPAAMVLAAGLPAVLQPRAARPLRALALVRSR
jgi:hypothetical protein